MYKKKMSKILHNSAKYFTQYHGGRSFEQKEGVFLKENSFFVVLKILDVFNCKQNATFFHFPPPPSPNNYLRNLAEFQGSESEVNNPSSRTKKTGGKEVALQPKTLREREKKNVF